MRGFLLACIAVVVLALSAYGQETERLPFDLLFPPAKQQEMGLQKLSPREREALRKHVEAMLLGIVHGLPQQSPSQLDKQKKMRQVRIPLPPGSSFAQQPPQQRSQQPQQFGGARASTARNVHPGIGGGHWIKENIDRGRLILLEDGSLWEVDRLERLDASLWLRTSSVHVAESSDGSPGFDYLLVNTDDREAVHAKYMGRQ